MKLMFNKTTLAGKWFYEDEDYTGYTEKPPQHTMQEWSEELGEWVQKTIIEESGDDQG